MKESLLFAAALWILVSCATAPKVCTPLLGGLDLVSSYEGECLRLSYHGEDLSARCSNILLVSENRKKHLHSVLFQTKAPRGIVSFNGAPHRRTSKIYSVTVDKVLRSERSLEDPKGKSVVVGHKDPGVCDVEILPGENIRVICSANDAEGKMSSAEFKTTSRQLISCREQYPDFHAQK